MSDGKFTAYKVSTDGNQIKRDFNSGLTRAEVDQLPWVARRMPLVSTCGSAA